MSGIITRRTTEATSRLGSDQMIDSIQEICATPSVWIQSAALLTRCEAYGWGLFDYLTRFPRQSQ